MIFRYRRILNRTTSLAVLAGLTIVVWTCLWVYFDQYRSLIERDWLLSFIFYLAPITPLLMFISMLRDKGLDIAVSTEALVALTSDGKLKRKLDWSEVESVTVKNLREGTVEVVVKGKAASISWNSHIEGFSELLSIVKKTTGK